MIRFTAPCVPVAQPRQRHRIVNTKAGGSFVANYTPRDSPAQTFKATVRLFATQEYRNAPLTGPLRVRVLFVMPRPGRLVWKKRPMPRAWHASKPDLENIVKAFQDALTGIIWADDSQIAELQASKVYAAGDEQPHVEAEIEALEEANERPADAESESALFDQ